MFELEQYLKSDAAKEPDGEMIDHTVLAGRLTTTGYASAWALTHYLAKNRRAEFGELLRECSQLGPLEGAIEIAPPGVVRSNHAQFTRLFGDDLKDMETRLILHLKKQPYTDPFKDLTPLCRDAYRQERPRPAAHREHIPLRGTGPEMARRQPCQSPGRKPGRRRISRPPVSEPPAGGGLCHAVVAGQVAMAA